MRGLLEDALVMTRLLNHNCSRSENGVDQYVGTDHCPTYGQLSFSKLLGLSQFVVGSPGRAFRGCCTAMVVSLGTLP